MNVINLLLGIFVVIPGIIGKKYYVNDTWINFHSAFEYCASQGLQLATVNSKNEAEQLDKAIKAAGIKEPQIWLSGTDLGHEGKFVWLATGEPLVYTNWLPNQPDNNENKEHCIDIYWKARHTTQWMDSDCSATKNFACEEQPKNCYSNSELVVECERINDRK